MRPLVGRVFGGFEASLGGRENRTFVHNPLSPSPKLLLRLLRLANESRQAEVAILFPASFADRFTRSLYEGEIEMQVVDRI